MNKPQRGKMYETTQAHLALVSNILTQSGKGRRPGTACVYDRRYPARRTALIGLRSHIMGVNEDMRVNVDEPRTDNVAAHIKYADRFGGRNVRLDRSNLPLADRHVRL